MGNCLNSSVFSDFNTLCQITFSLQIAVLGGMSCSVFVVFRWEALSTWRHLQMQTMYFKSTWHFQYLGTWCLDIRFSSQPNNIREKFEIFPKGECVTFPSAAKKELATNLKQTMGYFLSSFHQDRLLIDCKALSTHLTWDPLWQR